MEQGDNIVNFIYDSTACRWSKLAYTSGETLNIVKNRSRRVIKKIMKRAYRYDPMLQGYFCRYSPVKFVTDQELCKIRKG